MNTVELCMLITPLAGLVAGSTAAAPAGSMVIVAGGLVGFVMGAALHPGVGFVVAKLPRLGDKRMDMWLAIVLVLYVVISPFLAWRLAALTITWALNGVLASSGR